MTTPTPVDLRALLAAGTPGPWEVTTDDHGRKGVDVGIWSDAASRYPVESLVIGNPNHAADAALIAAAVNALPALLDEIERGRELRGRVEAERDDLALRLSALLCDLTGGLMSKTGYSVATMVQAVEAEFEKHATDEMVEMAAQRDRAERRHERLESAVEALADEWQRTKRDQLPHLGCLDMYGHCAETLRAVLAETGAP